MLAKSTKIDLTMIGILMILFGYLLRQSDFQLGINLTPSEPRGCYLLRSVKLPLKLGQLVVFKLTDNGQTKNLLKEVLAVPGDKIFTLNKTIYNCRHGGFSTQCQRLGKCLDSTATARTLYCQNWHGEQVPEQYYYLGANRSVNSFDSRYFGLVYTKNIIKQAKLMIGFLS